VLLLLALPFSFVIPAGNPLLLLPLALHLFFWLVIPAGNPLLPLPFPRFHSCLLIARDRLVIL